MNFQEWWMQSDCGDGDSAYETAKEAWAAAHESCAKLCEELCNEWWAQSIKRGLPFGGGIPDGDVAADEIAKAIRARSNVGDNPPQPQR